MKANILLLVFSLLNTILAFAQDEPIDVNAKSFSTKDNAVGEFLKTDNKIYAVIVVISILLVGLFFYLYRLDKKIDRLRK